MNPETVVAIVTTGVSVLALVLTGLSVRLAKLSTDAAERAATATERQSEIQEQIRKDSAQPYIWLDIRGAEAQGVGLDIVLGNSGPTVATNVRVRIDPPLTSLNTDAPFVDEIQRRLADGLRSLPPGRQITWGLGTAHKITVEPIPVLEVTINADGPFGPIGTNSYVIDLADIRESGDDPSGNLHQLTKAVRELNR